MTDLYCTFRPFSPEQFTKTILKEYYSLPDPHFVRSPAGKPYIPGAPVHFNLSHSGNLKILAVSAEETGVDCESLDGKIRPAVLSRFTERERGEIRSDRDFLFHWTAREAYVKYRGSTLAELWRKTEFYRGRIFVGGIRAPETPALFEWKGFAVCLCPGDAGYSLTEI